jgi:hypothetical protein
MTVDGLTWVLLPLVALAPGRAGSGADDGPDGSASAAVAAGGGPVGTGRAVRPAPAGVR